MSNSEAKAFYDAMLESGDFKDMFPNLSGVWEKDKNIFIQNYQLNEDLLNDLDGIIDLDDEF